jgi:hypothetical protein
MRFAGVCAMAALLTACGDEDTAAAGNPINTVTGGSTTTGTPTSSNVRTNAAPIISGAPPNSVVAGTLYQFRPSTRDPDGDAVTYTVANRPAWAAFDRTSGRLQGIPGTMDARSYQNILISVSDGQATASLKAFSIAVTDPNAPAQVSPVPTVSANVAPTIRGTPPTSVLAGNQYSFSPTATDSNGDALAFSITNRPSWATFNVTNGRLVGTPSAANVGAYANIRISVSDGAATASLPAFGINVTAVGNGSATLSWLPPTQNQDGSALTNLAGYKVHWGTSSGSYTNNVTINNPGITSYLVENLVPGRYYFALSAFTSSGLTSNFSNEGTKSIQ